MTLTSTPISEKGQLPSPTKLAPKAFTERRDALAERVRATKKDLGQTQVLVAMKKQDAMEYVGDKDLHFLDATAQLQARATLDAQFGNISEADKQKPSSLEHFQELEQSEKCVKEILQCLTTMENKYRKAEKKQKIKLVQMQKKTICRVSNKLHNDNALLPLAKLWGEFLHALDRSWEHTVRLDVDTHAMFLGILFKDKVQSGGAVRVTLGFACGRPWSMPRYVTRLESKKVRQQRKGGANGSQMCQFKITFWRCQLGDDAEAAGVRDRCFRAFSATVSVNRGVCRWRSTLSYGVPLPGHFQGSVFHGAIGAQFRRHARRRQSVRAKQHPADATKIKVLVEASPTFFLPATSALWVFVGWLCFGVTSFKRPVRSGTYSSCTPLTGGSKRTRQR